MVSSSSASTVGGGEAVDDDADERRRSKVCTASTLVFARGIAGGVLGHRNVGLSLFHVLHSAILGVAVRRDVGCQVGVPGDDALLSRDVGEVGEMARSKIESGDAGSKGEASRKNGVVRRGGGGQRNGLYGEWGEVGEIGE